MSEHLDRSSREVIEQFISLTRRCLTPIKGYSAMLELYLQALKNDQKTDITIDQALEMLHIVQDYTEQFADLEAEWLGKMSGTFSEETRDESDV